MKSQWSLSKWVICMSCCRGLDFIQPHHSSSKNFESDNLIIKWVGVLYDDRALLLAQDPCRQHCQPYCMFGSTTNKASTRYHINIRLVFILTGALLHSASPPWHRFCTAVFCLCARPFPFDCCVLFGGGATTFCQCSFPIWLLCFVLRRRYNVLPVQLSHLIVVFHSAVVLQRSAAPWHCLRCSVLLAFCIHHMQACCVSCCRTTNSSIIPVTYKPIYRP